MYATEITVLFVFVKIAFADDCNVPVVTTTAGDVRGFVAESTSIRPYLAYKGIPFAKPPIGNLRFRRPEEPEPWTGIRDAKEDGPFCIQYNVFQLNPKVIGSEDCLYLSVFTHAIIGKAPVLVHIHGMGFVIGDKSKRSPNYLMDKEVVVVSFNYRLGIMGFLSFEDNELPGNQGMKDQVMALRWVQKNIAKFGGDPNRVTLVGESAGGASVIHHLISPLSKGLFHRAIAESGSSYNMWAVLPPGEAKKRGSKLANLASCSFNNTRDIVSCLEGKNANELVVLLKHFLKDKTAPLMMLFIPVLEAEGSEAFLTGPISSWKHNPVPLLIGMTSGEGLIKTKYFIETNLDFKWYNENFGTLAPLSFLYIASASNPDEITTRLKQFYFNGMAVTAAKWQDINHAYSDSWFTIGVLDAANKHTGDVYFYYFDYIGEYSYVPKNKTLVIGPKHCEEMLYIWCTDSAPNLKGSDLELSKNLVKIWTNFAKDGKAKSPESDPYWPTWNPKELFPWAPQYLRTWISEVLRKRDPTFFRKWIPKGQRYMHISNSGFKINEGLIEDRYYFWSSLDYKDKFGLIKF